jgi:hypothetical protein
MGVSRLPHGLMLAKHKFTGLVEVATLAGYLVFMNY